VKGRFTQVPLSTVSGGVIFIDNKGKAPISGWVIWVFQEVYSSYSITLEGHIRPEIGEEGRREIPEK
jgi:hypothetical protein